MCRRPRTEIRPTAMIAGRIDAPIVIRISDMDSEEKRKNLLLWLQEVIFVRLPPDYVTSHDPTVRPDHV